MGSENSQPKDEKKDKSLNICFFSHSSWLAGAERSLLQLITELIRDHGVICSVFLPHDGPLREKLEEVGASTLIFEYDWWCDFNVPGAVEIAQRSIHRFRTTFKNIMEKVENINPDVVCTNTMVIPWGAIIATILNKPHVWFVREFGILDHDLKFYLPFQEILNFIRGSSNIILTNSNALRERLFGNRSEPNILTIGQYIDIPADALYEDKGVYYTRTDATKLIIVGTISESKGQEDAILAVKELIQRKRNVELIVVGYSIPWYLDKLRDLVKEESLEGYVRFIDFEENVYPIMNQADIVLVCSRNEAFGRVIIEAMLLKKAVIGTKSGGTPELIEEEMNGLLFEPGDYKQLAVRIEHLLEHREKIKEFGEKGYEFAKRIFTKEKWGGKVYELLQSVKNMPNPSYTSSFGFVTRSIIDVFPNLESTLKEKDTHIAKLESALRNNETTLTNIYNSHGWKLLLLCYKMMDKLLPANSHRRNAVRRVFRGVVSLLQHLREKSIRSTDETLIYQAVKPASVRIDASTVCQLNCPSCPNAAGEIHKNIGSGFLKFENFKKIIDDNIWIRDVELSNWGEIFLNPDLLRIIKYAYKNNVVLRADNGVNLNTVSDEVLEALAKYRFNSMTCSIDGSSQETYSIYRRNGNFEKVMEHIRRINHYKSKYRSEFPLLTWQFVAFGHNTHEIGTARKMANDLKMNFFLKLSWDNLYLETFSPVTDKDLVSKESGLGVSSREEYLEKTGKDYIEEPCCTMLWRQPQINFDGRVLGCCVNYRGDFGNVFKDGLIECLNNEKINYAREMLLGIKEGRDDIPCAVCKLYESRKKRSAWVKDVAAGSRPGSSLTSQVYPLRIPLPAAGENGWKPYFLFSGVTAGMRNLSCHVSVLNMNHCPHLPHTHEEEEILLLLSGEVDLILPDRWEPNVNQRLCLKPGEFVYYPAYFAHTLQTTSETPANYLMFKWQNHRTKNESPLTFGHFKLLGSINASEMKDAFCPRLVFEGPTGYLRKLHCHTSTLTPGAGYGPHIDDYDVAMTVLDGEVETLGNRVGPHSVIFYRAGEPHGIGNPGESVAKYVVFEFHGDHGEKRK